MVKGSTPYSIPLYFPPFPTVMNVQRNQPNIQRAVSNALRNYQAVNTAEINRLKGDLTAYRQESQSNFKQRVLAPRGPNEARFRSFKENIRDNPVDDKPETESSLLDNISESKSVDIGSLPGQSIQSLMSYPPTSSQPFPLQRNISDESSISEITEAETSTVGKKQRKTRTSKKKTKKELIAELTEMGVKATNSNTSKQIQDVAKANKIQINKGESEVESIDKLENFGELEIPPLKRTITPAKDFLESRQARPEFNATIIEPPKQLTMVEKIKKAKAEKAKKEATELNMSSSQLIEETDRMMEQAGFLLTSVPSGVLEMIRPTDDSDEESEFGMSVLG